MKFLSRITKRIQIFEFRMKFISRITKRIQILELRMKFLSRITKRIQILELRIKFLSRITKRIQIMELRMKFLNRITKRIQILELRMKFLNRITKRIQILELRMIFLSRITKRIQISNDLSLPFNSVITASHISFTQNPSPRAADLDSTHFSEFWHFNLYPADVLYLKHRFIATSVSSSILKTSKRVSLLQTKNGLSVPST